MKSLVNKECSCSSTKPSTRVKLTCFVFVQAGEGIVLFPKLYNENSIKSYDM